MFDIQPDGMFYEDEEAYADRLDNSMVEIPLDGDPLEPEVCYGDDGGTFPIPIIWGAGGGRGRPCPQPQSEQSVHRIRIVVPDDGTPPKVNYLGGEPVVPARPAPSAIPAPSPPASDIPPCEDKEPTAYDRFRVYWPKRSLGRPAEWYEHLAFFMYAMIANFLRLFFDYYTIKAELEKLEDRIYNYHYHKILRERQGDVEVEIKEVKQPKVNRDDDWR